MADQQYQVVFRGLLVPGASKETVKANLAKLFKTDEARIAPFFSGEATVIKKGLSPEEGERYGVYLKKAGALCEVIPVEPSVPPPPPQTEAAPPKKAVAPPQVDPPEERGPEANRAPAEKPHAQQKATALQETVSAVRNGDVQKAMDVLQEKVQDFDRQEAGRKIASLVGKASASVKNDYKAGGAAALTRNKLVWALAGIALIVLASFAMQLGRGTQPMPIEAQVISNFAKQYNREVRKADLGNAGAGLRIGLARQTVEDMGYNYDRTLLLWLFRKDLVESNGGMDVYTNIMVEPVKVAVAADLSEIRERIAPETHQIFGVAAEIPLGVDLRSIRMIKSCPATGDRLKHDDLLQVLQDNAIPIDAGAPDLAIANAFFGLERAGLLKIQRRWENDVQYSDIEVLDPEAMATIEGQLEYLQAVEEKFASN
jgi:hypothetical protein